MNSQRRIRKTEFVGQLGAVKNEITYTGIGSTRRAQHFIRLTMSLTFGASVGETQVLNFIDVLKT